jgi:hypothetical protein
MRLRATAVLVIALFVLGAGTAFCQRGGGQPGQGQGGQAFGQGGRQFGGGQMLSQFAGGIQQVIAAPDGSIIVVTRTRLIKYDKDLNLVKEVTVTPDPTPARPAAAGGGAGN